MTSADSGSEDSEYWYEVLTSEEDIEVCARIAAESFSETNPFTRFHGFTADHFYQYASLPLIREVVDERLSMLARHRRTGQVVGCVIPGDLSLKCQRYKPDTSWYAADDFLHALDELFLHSTLGLVNEQLPPNVVLHVLLSATKVSETGKGVMGHLTHRACQHARKMRPFQYVHTQITHPATRHLYENKLGAKVVSHIDPVTWRWKRGGDACPYPYKDWKDGSIVNVCLTLNHDRPVAMSPTTISGQ